MNCKMQLAFIKCKQIKEAHFNEHNLNVMTSESKYINISNYHTETTFQLPNSKIKSVNVFCFYVHMLTVSFY